MAALLVLALGVLPMRLVAGHARHQPERLRILLAQPWEQARLPRQEDIRWGH